MNLRCRRFGSGTTWVAKDMEEQCEGVERGRQGALRQRKLSITENMPKSVSRRREVTGELSRHMVKALGATAWKRGF